MKASGAGNVFTKKEAAGEKGRYIFCARHRHQPFFQ